LVPWRNLNFFIIDFISVLLVFIIHHACTKIKEQTKKRKNFLQKSSFFLLAFFVDKKSIRDINNHQT
jgi:hypothetical protein